MISSPQSRIIWLLAGETSGDEIGARLIQALKRHDPSIRFIGVGGPRMRENGMEILFPMHDLAVMGLVEVLPKIRFLSKRLNQTIEHIEQTRPNAIVTIDSPGFSLRLLKRIQNLGIPRIHYVAPQVWAWHESRVKKFPGRWEKLLCLLPFEEEFFRRHNLDSDFVGHPILESQANQGDANLFRKRHQIAQNAPILLLMPGSRRSELPKLMPIFRKTLKLLKQKIPNIVAVIPASPISAHHIQKQIQNWPIKPLIINSISEKHDAYAAAGAALTKSGTTTLELALAKVPMAVTYRVNPLTAFIARRMIKVPYVAMVNLLAQREIVPELLQENCRPDKLAQTAIKLLINPEIAANQRAEFEIILHQLLPKNGKVPSDAAAEEILKLIA